MRPARTAISLISFATIAAVAFFWSFGPAAEPGPGTGSAGGGWTESLRGAGDRVSAAPGGDPDPAEVPAAATAVTVDGEGPPASPPESVRVPILIYHHVRPRTPGLSAADRVYEVTPEGFRAQMRLLVDQGLTSVSLAAVAAALARGEPLPERPVVITFDDGRASQYGAAFPVVRELGLTATFFVFTNAIDRPGYLTWAQLSEMVEAGMEIGSHTRYHPFLTKIDDEDELDAEIVGSKRTLEERLGITVSALAYPFGLSDARIAARTAAAGYACARGLRHGVVQTRADLFDLKAHIVTDDLRRFAQILGVNE